MPVNLSEFDRRYACSRVASLFKSSVSRYIYIFLIPLPPFIIPFFSLLPPLFFPSPISYQPDKMVVAADPREKATALESTSSSEGRELINASGHRQELERNFSLLSICAVAITTGNTWIAQGGSVVCC